jgi:hypothetical protein
MGLDTFNLTLGDTKKQGIISYVDTSVDTSIDT